MIYKYIGSVLVSAFHDHFGFTLFSEHDPLTERTCDEGLIYHRMSFNNTAIHWKFASWNHLNYISTLYKFHIYLFFTAYKLT